ncbi:hypothetical protein QIG19_28165, partial [Klebsiella pneumoniae]|nr:hypothetical protein [Klebsiella pneumoniae]
SALAPKYNSVIANEAKQSILATPSWIASSLSLLAMTKNIPVLPSDLIRPAFFQRALIGRARVNTLQPGPR